MKIGSKLQNIESGKLSLEDYNLFLDKHYSLVNQSNRLESISRDVISLILEKQELNPKERFILISNLVSIADLKDKFILDIPKNMSKVFKDNGINILSKNIKVNYDKEKEIDEVKIKW